MQRRLVVHVAEVGEVHGESDDPTRSSGLDSALDHRIDLYPHVMELDDLNLQLYDVPQSSPLVGLLAEYMQDYGVLTRVGPLGHADENRDGL